MCITATGADNGRRRKQRGQGTEKTMQFILNSRLGEGVTRERFIEYVRDEEDHKSWELVRKGIIQQWLWKTGDEPGLVVLMNCADADEARRLVDAAPIVEAGILTFEIEPVDPFPNNLLGL